MTSGNGDYIVSLLASGVYAVTFELSGFGPQTDLGPTFGQAVSRFAYTTPQSMRVSFGVRF